MGNLDRNLILYFITAIGFFIVSAITKDIFWTFVGACFLISAIGYVRKKNGKKK